MDKSHKGVGEWVLLITAYTGRLHPKGVPLQYRLQVYQRGALHKLTCMKG